MIARREWCARRLAALALGGALGALGALALASLAARAAFAQEGAVVTVTLEGDTTGVVRVTERMRLAADSGDTSKRASFQYLARPCSAVGDVILDDGASAVPLVIRANGPWRSLEDTASAARGTRDGFTLRYEVRGTAGALDLPLVLPTLPIPRGADTREGSVHLIVRLADARGAVTFPRLERLGTGEWSARFVALPSFVSVQLTEAGRRCAEPSARSDDGGLSWRFWLLVAILVVWVPVYQWWALRQSREDA